MLWRTSAGSSWTNIWHGWFLNRGQSFTIMHHKFVSLCKIFYMNSYRIINLFQLHFKSVAKTTSRTSELSCDHCSIPKIHNIILIATSNHLCSLCLIHSKRIYWFMSLDLFLALIYLCLSVVTKSQQLSKCCWKNEVMSKSCLSVLCCFLIYISNILIPK